IVHDQPLVDEAFERVLAEALDAGGAERIAAAILAVANGHHAGGGFCGAGCFSLLFAGGGRLLWGRWCRLVLRWFASLERGWSLRAGRGAGHQEAECNANRDHSEAACEQYETALAIDLLRAGGRDFRRSFLARHGGFSKTVTGVCGLRFRKKRISRRPAA